MLKGFFLSSIFLVLEQAYRIRQMSELADAPPGYFHGTRDRLRMHHHYQLTEDLPDPFFTNFSKKVLFWKKSKN
jgi:hypothetical protein